MPLTNKPAAHGRASEPPPLRPADEVSRPRGGGFAGDDLTCYFRAVGRPIGMHGRPKPPARPKPEIPKTYVGWDLSLHRDLSRKTTSVYALHRNLQAQRRTPFWLALWLAIKWLFSLRFKFLVIERYVWGEVWNFFLVGTLAFTIFMMATTVFTYGEKIFSKNIPPFTIAKILLLTAPNFLVLAVPVAVLFATLMAMNRFARDNELTALISNGVSLYRIFVPFIALAIFAGLITWTFNEHIAPPNIRDQRETLKIFWEAQVVDFIKPGIVISAPDRKFFYVDSINKTEGIMYGLRLYDYFADDHSQRRFPRIFLAKQGYIADSNLVLNDVTVYELDQYKGNSLVQAKMPEVKIDIATKLSEYPLRVDPSEMPSGELRTRIARDNDFIKSIKYQDPRQMQFHTTDITQYYLKFAIPCACLAFVLVAVPVSLRGPRDERNLGLILTFVLVMIYYVILFTCREVGSRGFYLHSDVVLAGQTLIKKGTNMLPGIIAGWTPPLVFFIASFFLILKARK